MPKAGGAFTGNVTFGDNNKAIFGASSDLQIFHDGQHSYISDQGSGNLKILGAADVRIVKSDDSELSAKFVMDGAVELYHNNVKTFETTSAGIDVTGTVTADGLTVTQTGSTTAKIGATGTSGDNDGTLIINNGGTGDGMLRFDYETATDRARIGVSASDQSLQFFTAGNNERMRIDSSGVVRIGGQTGTLKLGNNGTYHADIEWEYNNNELAFTTNNVGNFTFNSNGSERMRINSSGSVGIGTSAPKLNANAGTFLTVMGTSNSNGWLEVGTSSQTNNLGGAVTFNNTNVSGTDKRVAQISSLRSGADNVAHLSFSTNHGSGNAERMRLAGNQVTIGDSATSYTPSQFEVSAVTGVDRHSRSISSGTNSRISGSGQSSMLAEGVVAVDTVSAGTVLTIPHFSQPNLWRPMYVELMFVSGEYNRSTGGLGGFAKCGYSALTTLTGFAQFEVGGNVGSVSINGMNLLVNFTSGYVNGLANYEGVCMHYKVMSITPDYFQAWNATLN